MAGASPLPSISIELALGIRSTWSHCRTSERSGSTAPLLVGTFIIINQFSPLLYTVWHPTRICKSVAIAAPFHGVNRVPAD